jgi:hypothetical protein
MVLVLALPRSGSSLMMNLIKILGLDVLGYKYPIGRNKNDNLSPFWEDSNFMCCDFSRIHNNDYGVKVNLRKFVDTKYYEKLVIGDKVIVCDRDIDNMTDSQHLKGWGSSTDKLRCKAYNLRCQSKYENIASQISVPILVVNFETLLTNKLIQVNRICNFLELPNDHVLEAVAYIQDR